MTQKKEHLYCTIERSCRDGFIAFLVAKHGEREIHLTNGLETKNFQQERKKGKLSSFPESSQMAMNISCWVLTMELGQVPDIHRQSPDRWGGGVGGLYVYMLISEDDISASRNPPPPES
jgi:hypothetical protein